MRLKNLKLKFNFYSIFTFYLKYQIYYLSIYSLWFYYVFTFFLYVIFTNFYILSLIKKNLKTFKIIKYKNTKE